MNYLAHLQLAGNSESIMLGNLIGDFVKGSIGSEYSREITRGIVAHRKIDAYADSHPIFKASRRLVSPVRRRFSGIIVDMGFDHFLAKNWGEFSDKNLELFIEDAYALLIQNTDLLPARLRQILPIMVEEDWHGSYITLEGIHKSLHGISRRFKLRYGRDNNLSGGVEEIKSNYDRLEQNFKAFYPYVTAFAKSCIETQAKF